ncbi:50S ribosomal protein L27 [Mycoplasmoides pirum]|uniref:50S ribosomal protein L27 n=1 Tax=Mycoplasmoides pirum TaxID=2122 RepID=UPI000699098F|nr:50S ribosomal protein L27 [Mycoplasmoides pirum]
MDIINNKKIWFNVDLQFFASKKGVGSTKNGRDSNPKFLGAKLADGQLAKSGQIIYRQRGNVIWPGKNVGQGKDDTLFALSPGIVKYTKFGKNKTKVSVIEVKIG